MTKELIPLNKINMDLMGVLGKIQKLLGDKLVSGDIFTDRIAFKVRLTAKTINWDSTTLALARDCGFEVSSDKKEVIITVDSNTSEKALAQLIQKFVGWTNALMKEKGSKKKVKPEYFQS